MPNRRRCPGRSAALRCQALRALSGLEGRRTVAGVLTGAAALAVGELAAASVAGARSPLVGLGRGLIDATPGPVVDVVVALVGETDKPLLAVGVGVGAGLVTAAAGLLAPSRPRTAALLVAGARLRRS